MRRCIRPTVEALEGKVLLSGSDLALSLTATQTNTPTGPKVVLTFTETNVTNHDVNASYGPSVDGFVATQNGKAVWSSNAGINPYYIVLDTLKPGQSVKLTATWDGHSDLGTPGFPGTEGPAQAGAFVIHNELAPGGPTATVTLGSTQPSGSDLAYSLTASPSSASPGTPVVLTFTETNVSEHVVTVERGPIGGFVATEGGKTVWFSNSGAVPQVIWLEQLNPGQSVKIMATWDGRSDVGAYGFPGPEGPPLTGTFVIHNELAPGGPTATVTLGPSQGTTPPLLHPPTHIVPPRPPARGK